MCDRSNLPKLATCNTFLLKINLFLFIYLEPIDPLITLYKFLFLFFQKAFRLLGNIYMPSGGYS